jgi:excisionase family DNA binding protein
MTEIEKLAQDGALTIAEATRWLGIGRSQLYAMIALGEIRSLRIGRRRLVPRAELRAYLAARLAESDPGVDPRPAA